MTVVLEGKNLREGEIPYNTVIHGDAKEVLRKLPENCIDCVITSPPYYAKRDYGVKSVFGGDSNCDHDWNGEDGWKICKKCGAQYSQLGLEPTPHEFVTHLIDVFREIKRILKPHGNVFVLTSSPH